MSHMKLFTRLGQTAAALLAALLLIGGLMPTFRPDSPPPEGPLRLRSGLPFKHSDEVLTQRFVRSLRDHGGLLCLGTSETTTLAGGNWPDFLNADTARAAVLAGAGRTPGVHLPWLEAVKGELAGLGLVYYLNPVYWNAHLGQTDPAYFLRYTTPHQLRLAARHHPALAEAFAALPLTDRFHLGPWLRALRRPWFQDFRWRFLSRSSFDEAFAPLTTSAGTPPQGPSPDIDLEKGMLRTFAHADWFSPALPPGEAAFRDAELLDFIAACEGWGVELTVVLGPPNLPFIRHHFPDAAPASQTLQAHLRALLSSTGVHWVDATDIGEIPGAFHDHQHISSFGAFLIAERLRETLNLPPLDR